MSSSGIDVNPSLSSRLPPRKDEDPEKLAAKASLQNCVPEQATVFESGDHTERRLKSRHVQLIGIGGTIGTALYVQYVHLLFLRPP